MYPRRHDEAMGVVMLIELMVGECDLEIFECLALVSWCLEVGDLGMDRESESFRRWGELALDLEVVDCGRSRWQRR